MISEYIFLFLSALNSSAAITASDISRKTEIHENTGLVNKGIVSVSRRIKESKTYIHTEIMHVSFGYTIRQSSVQRTADSMNKSRLSYLRAGLR